MIREERNKFRYNACHRINDDGVEEKRCSKCGEWKLCNNENFYSQQKNGGKDGLNSWCKVCFRLGAKLYGRAHREEYSIAFKAWHLKNKKYINNWCVEWRKTHHEEKRIYEKEYYLKYPEKFKQYNENHRDHDITKKEWTHCLEAFDYKCAYCGISEEEHLKLYNQVLHKDHADCMGANDLSNAIPACRSCNSQKHDNDIEIWFKEQKFFDEEKLEFIMWWLIEGHKNYIEDKPPYRIIRKRNEGLTTYHFELWSVDEMRNEISLIVSSKNKKGLDNHIKEYLTTLGYEG